MRYSYGRQMRCKTCTSDIEYHGPPGFAEGWPVGGWRDRGGNRYCDTSGMAPRDAEGNRVKLPHRPHTPYLDGRTS